MQWHLHDNRLIGQTVRFPNLDVDNMHVTSNTNLVFVC